MKLKHKAILPLILLSALVSVSFLSVAYSNDSAMQKQVLEDPNNPNVYVRISDQTLVFSYYELFGIFKDGKSVSKKDKNSLEMPLEADDVSFIIDVTLPGYEQPYRIQYFLEAGQSKSRGWLSEIKKKLEKQGKKIEDLPKQGKFYEHISEPLYGGVEYISANDVLINLNGDPLVLSLCNTKLTPLMCYISFDWKRDIKARIRPNGLPQELPHADSVDIWLTAYPLYLKTLNKHVVQSIGGQ